MGIPESPPRTILEITRASILLLVDGSNKVSVGKFRRLLQLFRHFCKANIRFVCSGMIFFLSSSSSKE
jgi:hypothetical protein